MTTSEAAQKLGISPDKLRRWVREGRFADIAGISWDDSGFKQQRLYTDEWVRGVADKLGVMVDSFKPSERE
jgi:DNA-binding transcriptional MerR regulator